MPQGKRAVWRSSGDESHDTICKLVDSWPMLTVCSCGGNPMRGGVSVAREKKEVEEYAPRLCNKGYVCVCKCDVAARTASDQSRYRSLHQKKIKIKNSTIFFNKTF